MKFTKGYISHACRLFAVLECLHRQCELRWNSHQDLAFVFDSSPWETLTGLKQTLVAAMDLSICNVDLVEFIVHQLPLDLASAIELGKLLR